MTSEWETLERAQGGDGAAWRDLTSKYQPRVMAVALFITRSVPAAEDVVQETFARALRARIRHREGSVQGFLGTIAYRLALKEVQRARRFEALDAAAACATQGDPLADLLTSERDRSVAESIQALPDEHRDVLVLRFYGGHRYEEIAALLRVPLGTVKSRMFYAVQSCRNRLRQGGWLE